MSSHELSSSHADLSGARGIRVTSVLTCMITHVTCLLVNSHLLLLFPRSIDKSTHTFLAMPNTYELMEKWAEVLSKKPLTSPDGLSVKQKEPSFLEQTTKPPRLHRDPGFLAELEKHYNALLTALLCL